MELHKIFQDVLEEEQAFELGWFEALEKKGVDLKSNDLGDFQAEMSRRNAQMRRGTGTIWQKQTSVLTCLLHSFEVESQRTIQHNKGEDQLRRTSLDGVSLARFLNEAGWHLTAARVYSTCLVLLGNQDEEDNRPYILGLLSNLLESAIFSSQVEEASNHAHILQEYLDNKVTGKLLETSTALASALSALSSFWFLKSQFDASHVYACKALQALSPKSTIQVNPCFPLFSCRRTQLM